MAVVIETTIGDITVDLFTEERPVACMNFLKLCKLKYYNYNLFHTIEQGFIAQTGDPSGVGDGGTSLWGVIEGTHKRFFEAETLPKLHHSEPGLLSLVSAGKSLVASQFFFTLGSNLTSLDGIHCVIGEVVEGHETLRKLNEAIVDADFRPYQDIRITHTVVLDDPYADPRGYRVPSRSPSPSAERLKNGRIAADEDIDDTDGKTMEEIQEMLAEREAKARATILEIVGDLPDAEMAPPENVLFICKLNPVTTDDDLEIIFSRFGKVKGCEVIRDKKSGDSLQYAFVEFEDQKSCEAAYFKMDNVLIDDRRIHVDFSQSVARVKWRGKGRGVEGADDDGRLDFNNLRSSNPSKGNSGRGGHAPQQRRQEGLYRPNRIDSTERRKAREERHREQEEHRRKSRSHSRSRQRQDDRRRPVGNERGNERHHDRWREEPRRAQLRDDSRERKFVERRRLSRSRSRERPARRCNSPMKRSPDRRRRSPRRERPQETEKPRRRDISSPNKRREYSNDDARTAKRKHQEAEEKKKNKSRKHETSSESSSSSSSESETESSESSSSSSSSEDERRKKSSKKSKKHKSNTSKHKKKKKQRK